MACESPDRVHDSRTAPVCESTLDLDIAGAPHRTPGAGRFRAMATVTPISQLRRSPTAALFEGCEQIDASIFVTEYQRGQGPDLHLHPYPEAFVVETGTALFTAGDEELRVGGGNVVVVPAETPHGFKCASEEKLRVVSVHPNPRVEQTDL